VSRCKRVLVVVGVLGLASVVGPVQAQVHSHGSTWIHRDDDRATLLHAPADSLCWLGFPARCWGGMMAPDSLYCEFWTVPPESLPTDCFFAYGCSIEDPAGHSMMPGHRMPNGFFVQQVEVVLHYDPAEVSAAGGSVGNLVLVSRDDSGYSMVTAASHDQSGSRFELSTDQVASWYGIVDRSLLPAAVRSSSWSGLKRSYR